MATSNMGYQSFYQTTLSSNISDTDLTIPLTSLPTPSEGYLVIESTISTKREIIYYTSKTASAVVCPADGRGYDGTTAVSHTQGASVIMAPVGKMFSDLRELFETTPQGWTSLSQTVSSVTNNGNRSYDVTFNSSVASLLSPGMRLRTTRTVAGPTQSTSLNGSSQYFSKTSPTGLTFTTTFTCSAWIKLNSYESTTRGIIARRNADIEGFGMQIELNTGRLVLVGLRAASNTKAITSYQSIPLNRWVYVAATLDMSAGDTTAQKIWIDGVEVPRQYTLTGTATTLTQGTSALVVGARYSGGTDLFPGKIAQAAVFSSQLSEATIRSYMSQGLTGTESTLVSAYSFNGAATDLNTTNANDLTANGSATATNADSPFGGQGDGTISSTLDYGIITKVSSAVATLQVPEGCTIPASGGVSAASYSTQRAPYNFPGQTEKWRIETIYRTTSQYAIGSASTYYDMFSFWLTVPVGQWNINSEAAVEFQSSTAALVAGMIYIGTSTTTSTALSGSGKYYVGGNSSNYLSVGYTANATANLTAATTYKLITRMSSGSGSFTAIISNGNIPFDSVIRATCAYL